MAEAERRIDPATGGLPDFVIVGAQKGGTTFLGRNLAGHPQIHMAQRGPQQQEIHFFSTEWRRGVGWYRELFQRPDLIQGEKTPVYLSREDTHPRMHAVIPHARLIIMLRNPVDRAYSRWNHLNQSTGAARDGWQSMSFEAALEQRPSILRRGRYVNQIRSLLQFFPREQLFIGISERFRERPEAEFNRLLAFLGALPLAERPQGYHVRHYPKPMEARTRRRLERYFEPYNTALFELLGEDIPEWRNTRPASGATSGAAARGPRGDQRNLPDFIIIGAQKSGTSALRRNLARHPGVFMAELPSRGNGEIHFFNRKDRWVRGVDWYRSLFPRDDLLQGEKTPNYINAHQAHRRMHSVVPDARLILILRNPADRAYSQWNHLNQVPREGWVELPFEEAVDRARRASSGPFYRLLMQGRYIEHIESLMRYYPRHQLYVMVSDRLRRDGPGEFAGLLEFLGLGPATKPFVDAHKRSYPGSMDDTIRKELNDYFRDCNEALFEFLGQSIPEWRDPSGGEG